MDRQAFEIAELKLAGDGTDEGAISGYGAVFNVVDRGADIVMPGAFKASIAELRKAKTGLPMLWQHWSSEPIGVWTDLVEDDHGLKVAGQLVTEVPQAAAARALVKAGAIRGLSIGYETVDYEIDRKTGIRKIKKAKLWEISLVTFPMNTDALISGVKGTFDPRELERSLREGLGLSSSAAVKAVALVKQHLRDGGDQPLEHEPRDGAKDMLMSLRRAAEALR
ncbi:HK97 family phage prohead protease [Sphingomonas sp. MG17]|uniref:HK97 family phage prohead protease n=1 Tax=Sphingomonas tagetis TaxID=2949092 RepID=A0A9X2HI13_9SPHN|nr:HK97 family phage prohead protease [Sphingomonas tagetis]MCP3729261.1 HK97 family phage prohead protease [Sphingomonas tagetis]